MIMNLFTRKAPSNHFAAMIAAAGQESKSKRLFQAPDAPIDPVFICTDGMPTGLKNSLSRRNRAPVVPEERFAPPWG
jgi:hypothetical protein